MMTFEDALLAARLKRAPQVAVRDGAAAEAEAQAALDAVLVQLQAGIDAGRLPVAVLRGLDAIDAAAERELKAVEAAAALLAVRGV